MLTDDGFHAWCLQNRIPAETKAYIEQAAHCDLVGEPILTGTSSKCSYLGMIDVSRRQFQETGTMCVERPTCSARRTLKSPKDQPHFPSHPLHKSLPPKGEQCWILQRRVWKLVED